MQSRPKSQTRHHIFSAVCTRHAFAVLYVLRCAPIHSPVLADGVGRYASARSNGLLAGPRRKAARYRSMM
eukprot:504716-Rhodomonas_salina.1